MREGGFELRISVHHSRGRQRECVVDTAHTQGTRKEKIMQGPEAGIARSVGRAWRVLGQSSRGRVGVRVCSSLDTDYFCPLCPCSHGLRGKGRENSLGKCLLTVAQLKAFDLPLIFCCLTLTCEVLTPSCPMFSGVPVVHGLGISSGILRGYHDRPFSWLSVSPPSFPFCQFSSLSHSSRIFCLVFCSAVWIIPVCYHLPDRN